MSGGTPRKRGGVGLVELAGAVSVAVWDMDEILESWGPERPRLSSAGPRRPNPQTIVAGGGLDEDPHSLGTLLESSPPGLVSSPAAAAPTVMLATVAIPLATPATSSRAPAPLPAPPP